ncbi:rubrerythrin family protein [Desulfovibrio mangrovi]|uniref:rubrerythrin family protein n=1 Tax=Desulfovibrio mangrovi TaxID=2976983 RepID=UPI0022485718|nr:rubrerythrin family protein [Desulfovibrio mangrovi]UZP68708.1 rubrerythrin family protein [Desulfovibrio mangrovi]
MSKTLANLMEAFAGESQANRKYLAYAKQAEKEGFPQVAKLFRAAADAETIHAHGHLRNAGKIGDTISNLKDAIAGETHEFKNMYPQMIAEAEAEGEKVAARYFGFANKAEQVHAELYSKMLESLDNPKDVDYYNCSVCGYTNEGEFTEGKCPICGAAAKAFYKVD